MTPGDLPQRITGATREQLAQALRQAYEAGATIRQLAAASDRSYAAVHQLLFEAGTNFRPRGGGVH